MIIPIQLNPGILTSQKPLSTVPDEYLFIVTHQGKTQQNFNIIFFFTRRLRLVGRLSTRKPV